MKAIKTIITALLLSITLISCSSEPTQLSKKANNLKEKAPEIFAALEQNARYNFGDDKDQVITTINLEAQSLILFLDIYQNVTEDGQIIMIQAVKKNTDNFDINDDLYTNPTTFWSATLNDSRKFLDKNGIVH